MPLTAFGQELKEKCAVFGVIGPAETKKEPFDSARLTYYGLWALQHRGQESSGIATSDGKSIHVHAGEGLVATVYREDDLARLPGNIAIGHNRYSTSGGADECFNQPYVDEAHGVALAHNGNLPDISALEIFLGERDIDYSAMNDSAMMLAAICTYMDDDLTVEKAIERAYPLFTGVFSVTAMTKDKLIAFRDKRGVRPLAFGKLPDGGYAFASETCALDTIGAKLEREVKPGEMIVIHDDEVECTQIVEGKQQLDIFEMVYFARPDSILLGKRVDTVRQKFGRKLAEEMPIDADIVVPVPDSGIPAAIGFSQKSGIKFEMALIKNRYIHRTFIRPTASLRERDLRMKLNPVIDTIKGMRVVLVDDSIVRGSTMRHLVSMVFEAGAKEVHLLITSPPVLYPDFYGINTPSQSELIAAHMTVSEMNEHIGATSLHFLSYDGMIEATGLPESTFTASCFSGDYPISIGSRAIEIVQLKPGEVLPKPGKSPILLANTSSR